jgi:hypothetical protein
MVSFIFFLLCFSFPLLPEMKSWKSWTLLDLPPAGTLMVVFMTISMCVLAPLSLKQMSPMVLLAARETQLHILTSHEVIRALICTLCPYAKHYRLQFLSVSLTLARFLSLFRSFLLFSIACFSFSSLSLSLFLSISISLFPSHSPALNPAPSTCVSSGWNSTK